MKLFQWAISIVLTVFFLLLVRSSSGTPMALIEAAAVFAVCYAGFCGEEDITHERD